VRLPKGKPALGNVVRVRKEPSCHESTRSPISRGSARMA
jgi:hypothetical protein